MTDHDDDVEAGQDRPKVRIVDKRRFRESDEASQDPAEASASPGPPPSELEQATAKASEYLDHLQRLQAEFDNYRKRVLKEQTRAVEMAAQPVVTRLLEVLDEFDLALMAAERSPDIEQLRKGVELVYAKLVDALRAEGLERIEAEGTVFDPMEHEALMQTGDGEGDPHVAEVFRQGYKLKGSVLRPASVRVERR